MFTWTNGNLIIEEIGDIKSNGIYNEQCAS